MTRNILISLLVNPGDVIMMTSALELMRSQLPPGTRLGVLVRPENAEIVEGNPLIDEVLRYPYRSGSPFFALGEIRKKIKAGGYDLFLSLDRRPRGAAAAYIAGIKEIIGPDILFGGSAPELWTKFFFTRVIHMRPEECSGSQVEMFQLVVKRAFNIEGKGRISLPPISRQRAGKAAELLPQAKGPVIGLCVRTNDPRKTWSAAGFAALIDKLGRELSAGIYITGSPGDMEYIDELVSPLNVPVKNLAGRTSLMDIPALAIKSDLFISLDNATAHLAANSGLKKIICLLLGTTPASIVDSMPEAKFICLATQEKQPGREQIQIEADLICQEAKNILSGC